MTKIKNTKKGMAKKTLSISLAVAMLATSNVPVWAAEFTDGSEAPFAAEAPVVEEIADVPEAQANGDSWKVTVKDGVPSTVEWGTNAAVTVNVEDIDGKPNDYSLKYTWKDAATDLAVSDGQGEIKDTADISTPIFDKGDIGKKVYLFIYDENGDWEYKSSPITVDKKDVTTKGYAIAVEDREYTGKETAKDAEVKGLEGAEEVEFDIDYTGDLVNVGTVEVTATPVDTTLYKGVIPGKFEITQAAVSDTLVSASMKTKEFTYTGNAIEVGKSDVTVVDKNTGVNLDGLFNGASTTATDVDDKEHKATVSLKVPTADGNFVEGSEASVETTDAFKVVARSLSGVKVAIDSNVKKPNGGVYTAADFDAKNVHFTDSEGNELNLFEDVEIVVPENVANFGTYTFTIKPAKDNKNVTGQTTATFSIFSQNIAGAKFTEKYATDAEEFTGEQIKKDVTKLGKVELDDKVVDPADYRVEFGENVNAGANAGEIYIIGQRTYEGSKAVVKFTINKATVTTKDLSASEYVSYNKDAKSAAEYASEIGLVVKAHNAAEPAEEFTLKEGTDYTVTYAYGTEGNAAYGTITATVTVKDTSNFKADSTLTKTIKIADKAIKDADIKLNKTSYEYTGAVIVPEFDVVVDGKTLVKDKDYKIVNIVDSAKVGTATLYVTGIKGTGYDERIQAKATFEVTPASAEKVEVKVKEEFVSVYDGTAKKPAIEDIVVTLAGNDVTKEFDITSYGENINAGEGTFVLTPKKDNKNYTAGTTKTATFEIKKATLKGSIKVYNEKGIEITNNLPTFDYDGKAKEFAKVVFVDNVTTPVTENDYEIRYVNNVTGNGKDNKGASIVVIAKGNYEADNTVVDTSTGTEVEIKNVVLEKNFVINSKLYFTEKEVTVTDAEYAGPNMLAKPVVVVKDGAKTLVEGVDYKLTLTPDGATEIGTKGTWKVEGLGVYKDLTNPDRNQASGEWVVVKKAVANLDIEAELNEAGEVVLTVMNGNLKVDNSNFEVTLSEDKKTATVAATVGNKYYVGSAEVTVGGEAAVVETPMIADVQVTGNNAKVILSGESDGAVGYDYVISTDRDCITNKDYAKVNKNILTTNTTFTYTQQGLYYAYCHAWRRDENGKKVFSGWSNAYAFSVNAVTPDQPVITSVRVSGSTVKVTYTKAANATGYDVVLGRKVATVAGEKRPVEYGKLVKKNISGNTVTATFTNVKPGTYYAGLHAFNRTSEDGKKVFSPWSNVKRVIVR